MEKVLFRWLVYTIPLVIIGAIFAFPKPGVDEYFERYLWRQPVLLVFAPSEKAPSLQTQRAVLREKKDQLKAAKVVVWEVIGLDFVAIQGARKPHIPTTRLQNYFQVSRDEFTVILLGLDGEKVFQLRDPVSVPNIVEKSRYKVVS